MSINRLASSNLTIKREGSNVTTSDIVLSGIVQPIAYAPSVPSFIKGKVSGISGDGVLQVHGVDTAGLGVTEDIQVDRTGWFVGDKTFATITQVQGNLGLVGATIDLRVSGSDGSAIIGMQTCFLYTSPSPRDS